MIQAPNSQYPQGIAPQVAQQPVQLAPAPQAETQQAPVQGGYYNYPSSNFYQYPQSQSYQPSSQANAVNIQIYNPQAYAGKDGQAHTQAPQLMPAQYMPMPAQTVPAAPVAQAAPAPQAVPPEPVVQEAPAQAAQPAQPAQPAQAAAPAAAPQVEQPADQKGGIDVPSFNARLRSENLDDQASAIEQIAELTQNDPKSATALLDTQIMEGLLGVIAKDTTGLQGPTPKQLELRQNIISGKQLSEAEQKEANTITPMETAERNKQYSLYTIAFLQNLLSSEVEQRNGTKLDIKDLPAIEQVVQTAKSDPNPLLRVSALASLSHIAKPEYAPVLGQIFDLAKQDSDANVQEAAKKASEQLAQMTGGAQAAQPAAAEAPKAEAPKAEAPKAEEAPKK
ncbi:MAG: hypothetical protein PHV37_01350 [Candidatus Gastranaerophilales bacterium]|nr:hypothetical protein [Candidatus Gastranaerophilales bacterium]